MTVTDNGQRGFSIRLDVEAVNSYAPNLPQFGRAPSIDISISAGTQTVQRPGSPSLGVDHYDEKVRFVELTGDGYPSVEIYWVRGGVSVAAIQDEEGRTPFGVPVPLTSPYPNRNTRLEIGL